jgi:hypothetical protein
MPCANGGTIAVGVSRSSWSARNAAGAGSPADRVRVQRQALLDVPDHLGLQLVAMRFQQRAAVGGVGGGPQDGEGFRRLGEVGAGLGDLHPGPAQGLDRFAANALDLGVDRGDAAEVDGKGDPGRQARRCHRLAMQTGRRRIGKGVARLVAGHHVEEQGEVAHVARHRAVDGQGLERVLARSGRHPAGRGPQADDPAEGGGRPQRAAEI